MATIEVHYEHGRVERLAITRDQTILIGSSPKCDIILKGEGVYPFHGRLRWKTNRFKADASPDAEFLYINGHKMASSSFRQGDEMEIGPNRIFMIQVEEDLPRDDKTRIQPAPPASAMPRARLKPMPAPDDRSRTGQGPLPRLRPWQKPVDWADLEVAAPSIEATVTAPTSARDHEVPAAIRGNKPASKPGRSFSRVVRVLTTGDRPPGQERIITSPLVITLAVALVMLTGLGITLRSIIKQTIATRQYQRAVEDLDNGDDRNAIRQFDAFLAGSPDDSRAAKARVLRSLANVRQFASASSGSWSNALEAEQAMVEAVGGTPEYRDSSTELAELILKTAEALADRAKATADPKALAEAESAVALHARVAGPSAQAFLTRSRVPTRLAEARATVRKASIRGQALSAMDAALKEGSSARVYAARDALVRQYADLADDRGLVDRMTRANDLIRRAVTIDASTRPAETAPPPEVFGLPLTLVLRTAEPSTARTTTTRPIVFARADGFAYGLDGSSGAPLWQLEVGLSAPFAPQPIPNGTTALVFDARHDELVRVDGRTGRLVWRQEIGEPVTDPPLVLGNQVIQTTAGGKLIAIDLSSGERKASADLGLPLARTPVSDEAGQYLYVLADKDCLFILSRDPLACVGVEYLGHASGSVASPPAREGRYLIVAENQKLNEGRWRVFVIEEDGARLRAVQQVAVPGWTWGTPPTSGSSLWAVGDRGSVAAFAMGDYAEKSPFRPIAATNPDPNPSGPAFGLARSERELWVASGRSARYELDAERGTLATTWTLGEAGPALAPIQVAGGLAVLTQQYTEGPGVALWGVDPVSGAVRWRTVLGSAWQIPLENSPDGDRLTTIGGDGQALAISRDRLASGGFVESNLPRPGGFRLPPGPLRRLEGDGFTVLAPAPGAGHLWVRTGSDPFRRLALPAPLGASPLLWGREVLVPGTDGRLSLIDPETGEARAEPFVPPFDRAHPVHWRAPVKIEGDAVVAADDAGRVRRLTRVSEPRPSLQVTAEANLMSDLVADPVTTEHAVILATADGRVRALATRDLSPAGIWPLDAPLALPPRAVSGRVFLADKGGRVLAIGPEGQRLWSVTLPAGPPAGPPVVISDSVWFLGHDGTFQRLAMADGNVLDRLELEFLPAGGLSAVGTDLVVPVALGTLRTLLPGPGNGETK
jgi:outer membrane protein assembly factor BamB